MHAERKTESTGPTDNDNDLFDVAIDNDNKKSSFGGRRGGGKDAAGGAGSANPKRQKKNEKYGFGGKKRFAKSGDAMSSADLRGFSAKKMKAGGSGGGSSGQEQQQQRQSVVSIHTVRHCFTDLEIDSSKTTLVNTSSTRFSIPKPPIV